MRHFFGLLLGVVVAAAVLLGGGWAAQEAVRGAALTVDPIQDNRMLIALGVMAAVGLLIGLVMACRVSPLAAFIPSMALLAWSVVYVLDAHRAAGLAPVGSSVQQELAQSGRGMLLLLSTGIYAMLGIALFFPVLMPSRWAKRWDDDEDYEDSSGF